MLSKAAKNDIVKRLSEIFKANPSVVLVEYKGLTVAELEGLRSNLKDADTEFKIAKNTLLKIAAKDTEIEQLSDLFAGPTAIAVCESDPSAAAKVFVKTAKDKPSLVIKGGIVEGNVVGIDEITAISKLPSRLEMMAQLLGALSSPMSNLLGSLKQMQAKLLYALEAIKDTKEETAVESKEEAAVETKEETAVESKEEAESESKTESKEESAVETKEETAVESKEEAAVEAKEEAGAESNEGNEVESKEES
jgi:large subunit ribosomal protein L10